MGIGRPIPCNKNAYTNQLGIPFAVNGHYVGTGSATFLNYEGHPGFDYRAKCTSLDSQKRCIPKTGTNVYAVGKGHILYPDLMVDICQTTGCAHPPSQYHVMELVLDDAPDLLVYYLHLSTYKDTQPFPATDPEYPLNYYNLACAFAEEGDKAKVLANLSLAFQHRDQVLKGEKMPDPRTDSSFQKYVRDDDFIKLMKKLGYE